MCRTTIFDGFEKAKVRQHFACAPPARRILTYCLHPLVSLAHPACVVPTYTLYEGHRTLIFSRLYRIRRSSRAVRARGRIHSFRSGPLVTFTTPQVATRAASAQGASESGRGSQGAREAISMVRRIFSHVCADGNKLIFHRT